MTREDLKDKATQEAAELLEDLHAARLRKSYPAMCDLGDTFKNLCAGLRELEDED